MYITISTQFILQTMRTKYVNSNTLVLNIFDIILTHEFK